LMKGNFLFQADSFGLATADFRLQRLVQGLASVVVPAHFLQRLPGNFLRLPGRGQF